MTIEGALKLDQLVREWRGILDCGTWSVIGHADDGTTIVHPLACRSWDCRSCAKRKKRQLLQRLNGASVHALLTLTCNNRLWPNPEEAFLRMSVAVNQLFKRIRRAHPEATIEYFLVWERTKAGWPHIHILLRAPFIHQHWLAVQWQELTGAPVIDIRSIHGSEQVISYIAKYLSKDPQAPQNMKRYRCSRQFFADVLTAPPSDNPSNIVWTLVRKSPAELAREFSDANYRAQAHPDGSFTLWPPGHEAAPAFDSLQLHPEIGVPA